MMQPMRVVIGMRVRLRKAHACGGDAWVVTRAGADVGLACDRCARRILLEREEFERRVRQIIGLPAESATEAPTASDPAPTASSVGVIAASGKAVE